MNNFRLELEKKLLQTRFNNFGSENYDDYRFGEFSGEIVFKSKLLIRLKRAIIRIIGYKKRQFLDAHNEFLIKFEERLQNLYLNLNPDDQKLVVELIVYRLLGYKKVKLQLNNKNYWSALELANTLVSCNDTLDANSSKSVLHKFNLEKIGYDIQLYFSPLGVTIGFILEQYAYKLGNKTIVGVEKGDIVFDLGACWGDTALYFASKAGNYGKVYSFEFVPGNVKLFNLNTSFNPDLRKRIELVQVPVSGKSNEKIYYKDNGPGSRIEPEPFEEQTGQTNTVSIDDFVNNNNIYKVDFIKMDIEGAESPVLKGAIGTIKRFKPKLAIAIYHSMDDFVNIPNWILSLNLGYELFLGHYSIHSEESILFARIKG